MISALDSSVILDVLTVSCFLAAIWMLFNIFTH